MEPPAPPTGAAPPPPPPEDFAANIRLSKYPEDIRDTIKQWADENPDAVQAARRGTRSDELVRADAEALVNEVGGDFSKLQKRWKPGDAWNPEEITAIRGLLRKHTSDVLAARNRMVAAPTVENQTAYMEAVLQQVRTQEIVHGVSAESGRSLRAFRQEAMELQGTSDVARLQELLRRVGGKMDLNDMAEKLAQIDINDPVAINNFLRNAVKPTLADKLYYVYINSILSGPKTHIINEMSNLVTGALGTAERAAAAGVEQVLARAQGRPVTRFFSEVPAEIQGAVTGFKDGVRAGTYVLKNGFTSGAASKWQFRVRPIGGKTGRVIGLPTDMLEAADAFNRSLNYNAALHTLTVRAAKRTGLKGQAYLEKLAELRANPPVNLIKEAADTAEYRLFRSPAGKITQAVMNVREAFPPFKILFPFIRTPVNIFKYGIERSPLGLLDPKLWRNLAAKSPEAADQIARIGMGSAIAGVIALAFGEGKITGAVPRDPAARDRFYREGKQPFSIRIGNRWVQYQRIEPINQAISQVAAAVTAFDENDDQTAVEKAQQAAFTIGQNMVSQTYLSSLSDLLNLLSDPERYGTTFGQRQLSGFVPFSSAARTAAQVMDPTIRKPGNIAEYFEAQLPGLSQRVPERLTALGEPATRRYPAWFPVTISEAQDNAVDSELARLGIEIGFVGDSLTVRGKSVKLTREQQQEYQIAAGLAAKEAITKLMESQSYQRSDKESQIKRVRGVIDDARDRVRGQFGKVWSEGGTMEATSPTPGAGAPPVGAPAATVPAAPSGANRFSIPENLIPAGIKR